MYKIRLSLYLSSFYVAFVERICYNGNRGGVVGLLDKEKWELVHLGQKSSNVPMTFGKYLSELRQSKHMSQRQLTRWAEVTNSTISRLENNQVSPDLKTIAKLAYALDVDRREIIDKYFELTE